MRPKGMVIFIPDGGGNAYRLDEGVLLTAPMLVDDKLEVSENVWSEVIDASEDLEGLKEAVLALGGDLSILEGLS